VSCTGPRPLASAAMLAMLFMPLANPAASLAQPLSASSQSDAQVTERVESLLRQMTLDEKIGQITQVGT
jgi:hypothetical protein